MKILGSTESNINKNENSKNEPHLSIKELLLVHWNILNNNYQQKLWVIPNKSFGPVLDDPLKNFIFSKIFDSDSELLYIEICFTDQNSKLLEIVDLSKHLSSKYGQKAIHHSKNLQQMHLKLLQKEQFK